MKKALIWALLGSAVLATGARAEGLYYETSIVKNRLEREGVTSCSKAFNRALDLLAKGRQFSFNVRTSQVKPDSNSVNVDFVITGNQKQYSSTGSIFLQPSGLHQCSGESTFTTVVMGSCDRLWSIEAYGYNKSEWKEILTERNGDAPTIGASFSFFDSKTEPGLRLILNDVGTGQCAITRIQPLDLKNR